jgi:hypothetical protein
MKEFKASQRVGVRVAACVASGLLLLMASGASAAQRKCLVVGAGGSYGTLQAAVDAAAAGGTLRVKGMCYGDTTISKALTIVGESNPGFGPATLNGGNNQVKPGSVIVNHTATVSITGLAITGGYSNSFIQGILAERGGGVYNEGGSVTLTDSIVSDNTAHGNGAGLTQHQEPEGGGGIYNEGGSLTLNDSTIAGNTGGERGGGIYNVGGAVRLTGSTVASNTASKSLRGLGQGSYGGGIYNEGGSLSLIKTTVTGNRSKGALVVFAGIGGGIYNERASLTITDSTVSGNEATVAGGGISAGSVTLNNSTVSGNTALEGGGVYAASITLNNSTVSDNTALIDIEREYGGLGGGIIDFESLTLNGSSSVIDNEAAEHGGGIYNHETGGATITDGIGWSGTVSGNKPDDIFNF